MGLSRIRQDLLGHARLANGLAANPVSRPTGEASGICPKRNLGRSSPWRQKGNCSPKNGRAEPISPRSARGKLPEGRFGASAQRARMTSVPTEKNEHWQNGAGPREEALPPPSAVRCASGCLGRFPTARHLSLGRPSIGPRHLRRLAGEPAVDQFAVTRSQARIVFNCCRALALRPATRGEFTAVGHCLAARCAHCRAPITTLLRRCPERRNTSANSSGRGASCRFVGRHTPAVVESGTASGGVLTQPSG